MNCKCSLLWRVTREGPDGGAVGELPKTEDEEAGQGHPPPRLAGRRAIHWRVERKGKDSYQSTTGTICAIGLN